VRKLRHLGLVVLEAADALVELGHADVGGVGDLGIAVHYRLHRHRGRGIRLDRDGVLAAERFLDDLGHLRGDLVAVGAHGRSCPAQRLALLRVRRTDRRKGENRGNTDAHRGSERPGSANSSLVSFHEIFLIHKGP